MHTQVVHPQSSAPAVRSWLPLPLEVGAVAAAVPEMLCSARGATDICGSATSAEAMVKKQVLVAGIEDALEGYKQRILKRG